FTWWLGPGIGCKGSKLVPVGLVNGMPSWGQFKPSSSGGYEPWAVIVPEVSDGRIVELTFFLDTARVFPLFGLPDRLDSPAEVEADPRLAAAGLLVRRWRGERDRRLRRPGSAWDRDLDPAHVRAHRLVDDLLEPERADVEVDRPVGVGDGHANPADLADVELR